MTGAVVFPVLCCTFGMLVSFFVTVYVYVAWYPSDRDIKVIVVLGD